MVHAQSMFIALIVAIGRFKRRLEGRVFAVGAPWGSIGTTETTKEGKKMQETILGAVLMGNMVLMFALWTMIKDMRKEQFMIKESISKEMSTIEVDIPDLDDLKQELFDVMSNMRTPSFVDHLGGMVSQFAQQKLMRQMHIDQQMIDNDTPSSEVHGSP